MEKQNIKHLLQQVASLINTGEKILKSSGAGFNIFRTLGVNHYENTHSSIIAEFLDPRSSHCMDDIFLKLFLKIVIDDFDFDTNNAKVTKEKAIPEGRLDLIIENKGKAIIIENKIYAKDQAEQLIRYYRYAERTYKEGNFKILYLNLWGDEASEQSAKDAKYIPISYKYHILLWMEQCAKSSYDKPMLRETLNQYANHIKSLTNMSIETVTREDIAKLITKDKESFKSAVNIVRAYEEQAKELVFMNVFQPEFRGLLNNIECDLYSLKSNHRKSSYYKIQIKPRAWRRFEITFEFCTAKGGASNLICGIMDHTQDKNRDTQIQDSLKNIFSDNSTEWWYFYLPLKQFSTWNGAEYTMMYDKESALYDELITWVNNIILRTSQLDM